MKRINMTLAAMIVGLGSTPCLAQQPAFDAASVKVVDPGVAPPLARTGGPGTSDPGRIHFARVLMMELLRRAYDVAPFLPEDQVVGGPAWIRDLMGPSYVIDATMPPDTTKEQFQLMLQDLLAKRFHLAAHHETQNFPGYDLVVAKGGPKLKEARPTPEPAAASGTVRQVMGNDGFPILPPGPRNFAVMSPGAQRVKCQELSMAQFATILSGKIALALDLFDWGTKRPRVSDKTGLTGKYNFILEFSCDGCVGSGNMATRRGSVGPPQGDVSAAASDQSGGGLPTIFTAVEKQLGLRLEKVKDVPLDVIVIDHVDKVPTEN